MVRSRRGCGGGGGGGVKVAPNLASAWDREGTRVLNLSVLRRLDPAVVDILITAAHVVSYSFDEDIEEWSRKPVEGSLFVVKRTENLVEDVLTDFEVQVHVPYVIYRNAAEEIIGIWFYNPQECEEVAHLFHRIKYAYARVSPKANLSSKSVYEGREAASRSSALPAAEDTLEQPTSPSMVSDDVEEFLLTPSKVAACVDTIGGTGAVQPNKSFRTIPSSHELHNASASQASALHNLFPSRTSSVTLRPFDAHRPHSSATTQSASLSNVKPQLLAPMASMPSTIAAAAASLSTVPPLHPPFADHQPQVAPLLHPFPLHTAPPNPPYGMPLLQPFPPPSPLLLLTPSASYSQVITREQVGAALLRLAQCQIKKLSVKRFSCFTKCNMLQNAWNGLTSTFSFYYALVNCECTETVKGFWCRNFHGEKDVFQQNRLLIIDIVTLSVYGFRELQCSHPTFIRLCSCDEWIE
ncbi:mRNA-decapping enzyme-like protein isoform X1 [Panicum miliaceum]|uniref:mRNA-decapping enzyme-like protein isoform X1 n=1 Tax=Panicum miliaceum TaxID=4540 RepID=A0A3L6S8T1_PANMI|nr:mRNA-decapping enzyme-like protein isoform X1 [Panicum miliaceum]